MNAPKNTQATAVQPYLFFEGRTEEAIDFYKQNIGAELIAMIRFKDSPDQSSCPGASPDKVMHASFRVRDSVILASDGQCSGKPNFNGFALSLTARDAADAEQLFSALSPGGQVQLPLTQTFFSPRFGMLSDKFGVFWMIYVVPADQR